IDHTLETRLNRSQVLTGQRASDLALQRDECLLGLVEGLLGERLDGAPHRVTTDIGVEHTESTEYTCQTRHQDLATPKAAGDGGRGTGGGASDRHQREGPWVEAALHADALDRMNERLSLQPDDTGGSRDGVDSQSAGDVGIDGPARALGVERYGTIGEGA